MPEARWLATSPHSVEKHTDLLLRKFVLADRFVLQAGAPVFENINGVPNWRMLNAANGELVAFVEIDPHQVLDGVLSIGGASALLARPAGAVGAGSVLLGISMDGFQAGDTIPAYVQPSLAAIAIGAETANVDVLEVVPGVTAVFPFNVNDRGMWVAFRRDASQAGDTFEDALRFLGIVLLITYDQ